MHVIIKLVWARASVHLCSTCSYGVCVAVAYVTLLFKSIMVWCVPRAWRISQLVSHLYSSVVVAVFAFGRGLQFFPLTTVYGFPWSFALWTGTRFLTP